MPVRHRDPSILDTVPDAGDRASEPLYAVTMTRELLENLSGAQLVIPEFRTQLDLAIVERIARRFPRLGDQNGWTARFGRELNATDDKKHFRSNCAGIPVLEGKHIEPFMAHVTQATHTISESGHEDSSIPLSHLDGRARVPRCCELEPTSYRSSPRIAGGRRDDTFTLLLENGFARRRASVPFAES